MRTQHSSLTIDTWNAMPFATQMANIGAEIERAFKWKAKNKQNLSEKALFRALELIDLTRATSNSPSTILELSRLRESLADYLFFDNTYNLQPEKISKFFYYFNLQSNKDR